MRDDRDSLMINCTAQNILPQLKQNSLIDDAWKLKGAKRTAFYQNPYTSVFISGIP